MEHYTQSLPYELELTSRVLHEAARCFFEQNDFPINQEEFVRFTEVHENLQKNLQYTPYVMYFKEGMLQDELIGSKEQIEIESFLKKNELENNKI